MKLFDRLFYRFFFGNYFYGCCVVALSIEANLQQGYPLNHFLFYLLLFCGTVVYYTHAYLSEKNSHTTINPRTIWYKQQKQAVKISQWVLTALILILGLLLFRKYQHGLAQIQFWQWLILAAFPLLAIWYYADTFPFIRGTSLRSNGWIKPFTIGFIWAAAVTIYPPFFSAIENNTSYTPGLFNLLLFIKNGMFITMLCILFDIKDYATDHNQQLKTFVVRFGLRKTLFWIIIPLTLIGLGTFLSYGILNQFPILRMLINTIPFILLIIVTYHMHRRKSILYYLAIIDGMMLIKALCGIVGSFIMAE